jgi:peroxiredoxin Q/BCP
MAKKSKTPSVGEKVPDFSLPSTAGDDFSLKDFKGKKVVLYFYPKDSTPGCTLEGHEFSKLIKEFRKQKTEVFGISRDSLKSHDNFKSKQNYVIELLSDSEEAACDIFDVIKEKNMYGKKLMGIERSTFLIGEDGKLLKEWRKVKAAGHAQEVLDAIKDL